MKKRNKLLDCKNGKLILYLFTNHKIITTCTRIFKILESGIGEKGLILVLRRWATKVAVDRIIQP